MPAQYYFDELDPASFQRLINSLLIKRYGDGIRLLPLRGADGGRDAETPIGSSFYSVTIPSVESNLARFGAKPGRYLFQVKHHRLADRSSTATRSAVLQDFGTELSDNVLTRRGDDAVDFFFLITNVPSSRDMFAKVDEKRREVLRSHPDLYSEILWQDHVTAWLDHTPSVWAAFPEVFAGRIVPALGQIASSPNPGLSLSLQMALAAQLKRDAVIRFRQINLEQRLARLFVDLDARSSDLHHFYLHTDYVEVEEVPFEEALNPHAHVRASRPGTIPLLTGEASRGLSKIILEGGPGQGKSTVTQMLAQIYRSLLVSPTSEYSGYWPSVRRARLPIRIELRLFAEWLVGTTKSVEQYLAETLSADAGGATITVEDVHNATRQQDVLLIFDGLDEVGSDVLRDQVVTKIVECVTRFETAPNSDLRVIVTSRPPAVAGRLEALNGFRRVQLQPLNDEKVQEYLSRWTEVQCSDAADRERVTASFLKRKSEDHVAALVKNPMQLSVLLHFIRLKGEAFPDKRAELYREYFKTVIDRDVEKSPELRRNRDDIEALHEVIGFTIHSRAEGASATSRLTRPDLIRLVRRWFQSEERNPDTGEALFAIGEERLGLIVALSGEGEDTQYGFEIQPVREYFAAAFINDKCEGNAHDLFEQMIRRPFWREVARFLAGLRRANERADLLSRARQLDSDAENGWRSDGVAIILQLLQEGVLSSPGHVHRDALSFVIGTLDAENTSVKVEPKGLVNFLPRLVSACDSDQPKQLLKQLMERSKSWRDHHDLKRLWSVCNRVFSDTDLCVAMATYEGEESIKAAIEIRWPVEDGKKILPKLEEVGEIATLHSRVRSEQLFFAMASEEVFRNRPIAISNHSSLVEEFAFQGLFSYGPIDHAKSKLAIWQLCEWLYKAGISLRQRKGTEQTEDVPVSVSGLKPELASLLERTLELLKTIATSGHANGRNKAARDLLHYLLQEGESDGIEALVAVRCATTLLGYVEGPRRVLMRHGRPVWVHMRPPSSGPRTETWQEFRKSLLTFYRAAFPSETDSVGRTVASQLAGRGFYRAMQSHLKINGEWVALLDLLMRHHEDQSGPEWLSRIPIQQYWLKSHLSKSNTLQTLETLSHKRLNWTSPIIPLDQKQIGWIAEVVRKERQQTCGTEVLFALQRSPLWGRFREGTLSIVLSTASSEDPHGAYVFEREQYAQTGIPEVVSATAQSIVSGSLRANAAISAAAATFMSEARADRLPPLRELDVLPVNARIWYAS